MKKRNHFLVTLLTILVLSLMNVTQVLATENNDAQIANQQSSTVQETTAVPNVAVTKIKIKIVNSDGTVAFQSEETEKYTVSYKERSYNIGEKIEVDVTVTPNTGYYFDSISKSDISFSGDTKSVSKGSLSSNSGKVKIEIKISAVAGELDSPEDVQWDENNFGYGEWDEVEGVTGYKVSINGSSFSVGNKTRVDLRSYLKSGKDNYFKVKATSSKKNVDDSDWSESDELYVEKYYDSGYNSSYNSGSSSGGWSGWNGSLSPNGSNYYYSRSTWVQNSDGTWYYLDSNGNIHRGWLELSDGKYYLNKDGIMLTGWQKISNSWYFFDGSGRMRYNTAIRSANGLWEYRLGYDGKMQTKCWQQTSDRRWYYIGSDAVEVGKEVTYKDTYGTSHTCRVGQDGFVIYGWYYDGKNWYYYDYGTGYKRTDTIIDGRYWLDKNGKWYK